MSQNSNTTSTKVTAPITATADDLKNFAALAAKLGVNLSSLQNAQPQVVTSPKIKAIETAMRLLSPNFWCDTQGNTTILAYNAGDTIHKPDGTPLESASGKSDMVVSYAGELPNGLSCTIQIYRKHVRKDA